MRIVSVRSELANVAYRPRDHKLSAAGVAPNDVVQISAVSVEFEKAFFYGLSAVPDDGSSPTLNVGAVWIGDGKRCLDEVTPECRASVIVTAAPGTKLDLKDFWVRIPNPGDRVFVKLQ